MPNFDVIVIIQEILNWKAAWLSFYGRWWFRLLRGPSKIYSGGQEFKSLMSLVLQKLIENQLVRLVPVRGPPLHRQAWAKVSQPGTSALRHEAPLAWAAAPPQTPQITQQPYAIDSREWGQMVEARTPQAQAASRPALRVRHRPPPRPPKIPGRAGPGWAGPDASRPLTPGRARQVPRTTRSGWGPVRPCAAGPGGPPTRTTKGNAGVEQMWTAAKGLKKFSST